MQTESSPPTRTETGGEAASEAGAATQSYARQVGGRLRRIRRQKGLSLQDVEAGSSHEFKASVLGAYERGERIISVPRLQRLAEFYDVPVDQLLPRNGDSGNLVPVEGDDAIDTLELTSDIGGQKVTFDLQAFEGVDDSQLGLVRQYLKSVQVMRQDFNGRVLTIRKDDIRAIAGMFGIDPAALVSLLQKYRLQPRR